MSDSDLQAEVDRLRAEVESYRQRELADLKAALSVAQHEAAHYRAEAQRNAEVGRQIASECQQQIVELRSKLEAAVRETSNVRRFGIAK